MKSIFRHLVINSISIGILAYLLPGVSYNDDLRTLISASLILALINTFIKPLLKLLFLPINLLSLGIFGWIINVIVLYLTTFLVPGFSIVGYSVGPANIFGLVIPIITLSEFWGLIFASFALNIIATFTSWVLN